MDPTAMLAFPAADGPRLDSPLGRFCSVHMPLLFYPPISRHITTSLQGPLTTITSRVACTLSLYFFSLSPSVLAPLTAKKGARLRSHDCRGE